MSERVSEPASPTALSVEGVVRREHFAELSRIVGKTLAKGGWLLPIAIAYWIVVLVAALALFRFADANLVAIDEQAHGTSTIVLLALLAGVLATFGLQVLIARSIAARQHRTMLREDGSYLGPRTFTLDAEGVRIEGAHGMTLTRWPVIMDMTQGAETLLLWTDPGAAIMVPKDAFANEAERAGFVAFAEARIGRAQAAS